MEQKGFSKKYIKKIADILIRNLELTCPYDPKKVINMTSGMLEYKKLKNGIDAYIKLIPEEFSYKIFLNKKKFSFNAVQKERFILAYELGHLFLHYGFLTDNEKWNIAIKNPKEYYYSNVIGLRQESEANEFADCFLMPEEYFTDQIFKNMHDNFIDIDAVAKIFGVSILAVQTRAKWLGLINW